MAKDKAKLNHFYAVNKQTGRKEHVPNSVVQSIINDQKKVCGYNAFMRVVKDPSMLNLQDYTNQKIDKPFLKGFTLARKTAFNALMKKAKELNK